MENKDLNRYEEQPAKENVFMKVLKMFLVYLKNLGYDFITSFKYNNMKLAAILVAVPGVLFGFFLGSHAEVLKVLSFRYISGMDYVEYVPIYSNYAGMPFDYTGMAVFALMLLGILNLFNSLSLSGKKNLGSVIKCTIVTAAFIIVGAAYLYAIFYYKSLCDNGTIKEPWVWNYDYVLSLITVIGSIVCSVAGCVIAFIKYDRTYEKVDR